MGRSALQARSARTASASRVTICRLHSRRRNRNPSRCGHDPQGGARPAVGNQRSMAADNAAAWPRDAEIPLTDVRSVPKTGLARPPPTQQNARKGRLNFLYARVGPWSSLQSVIARVWNTLLSCRLLSRLLRGCIPGMGGELPAARQVTGARASAPGRTRVAAGTLPQPERIRGASAAHASGRSCL